ncbi:hypothetical protein D1007_02927 [Hordeum vulgare]|nr:hypothetical protein D1007_02927 [Hordeum vulgare]
MEELTDDDKVEEMLDEITSDGNTVVNITVMRNIGGVLYRSPVKPQPQPVQVMNTQESSCLLKLKSPSEPEFALDYGSERHEYFMELDQEQENIEQMMEQNRNEEI